MKNMWDERYNTSDYGYGTEPNALIKSFIDSHTAGEILLPAEGEGRNAVYAASKGWVAHAFDSSTVGRDKALKLAAERGVEIEYWIQDLLSFSIEENSYDAVGLVYSHLHEKDRRQVHRNLINCLKSGGYLVLESFSKEQLQNGTGGPRNIDMLYSMNELKTDFENMEIISLEQKDIQLNAGRFHKGKGNVIQLVAKKI